MLPFTIELEYGEPVYEQMFAAVRRALFTEQLQDGDPFPSVRALSQELRISPTTAHKVVAMLKDQGLLVTRPGVGMVVRADALPGKAQRRAMLSETAARLVGEAKDLSLDLPDIKAALETEWIRQNQPPKP